jgi:hypothetical protein
MADRLVLPIDLYPVAPGDAPEEQPYQLQLQLTQIVKHLAAQVETLSVAAAPTKHTTSAIPTVDSDSAAGGRLELDALPIDCKNTPLDYIDPREWSDFASRTFADCLPPSSTIVPCRVKPSTRRGRQIVNGQRENLLPRRVSTYALLWCTYGRR